MGYGQKRPINMVSKRLGLLIATTGYADPQLPAVPDGAAHLNDLADVLRSPRIGGFSLTVLIDPTVETARSAIVDLLVGREPDDLVLLYVVGHCIRQTGDALFLALRETARLDLENTALPAAFVQKQLQETAAKEQIIILDSLLGSTVSTDTPVDRDLPLNVGLNFCVPNRTQAVLAASDYLSFCLAGEHYVAVRSAQPPVAESIVRELRSGAADEKGDRHVTVNGLLSYLKYVGSVRLDEMRTGWLSEGAGDLLVAIYPDKAVDQAKERSAGKPGVPVVARPAGSSLFDDNAKFTAYRPAILVPGKWRRMMVFMHLDEAATLIEIETRARQILGAEYDDYSDVVDSRFPIVRENEITLVPEVPGIRFNPPRRSFSWVAGVRMHEESFFIHAPFTLVDKLARGRISVFFGQLLMAEIALNLRVAKDPGPKEESWAKGGGKRFRKVFASYSDQDAKLVEAMERQIQAIGCEYLREIIKLRKGQQWNERLLAMIVDADVFQLFWSRNAAQSAHVEKEWRHAIALRREAFVRPAYWEIPMPEAPDPLRRLRFCFLPGIHTMTDRRKEKDADREGAPVEDKRIDKPIIPVVVPPSKSPPATKSQSGSTGKVEGTGPRPGSNKNRFGKTSDLPSSKASSVIPSQEKRTSAALALVPRPTAAAKVRQKRIVAWSAIFGTVIGGCFFIFLSINIISRTFLKARHPFTHSKAAAPSATPSMQATPSAIVETPILATPTPSPIRSLETPTPSPPQPLETPTPVPTAEQPAASPSVAPSSTPSPEDTESDRPTYRGRHHRRHRLHHKAANSEN
jgi:TIR domain